MLYVQTTGRVARLGYHIAYDYQPIFGLTDEQMADLLEYLRFWDPLRTCCGKRYVSGRRWRGILR